MIARLLAVSFVKPPALEMTDDRVSFGLIR